MIYRRETWEQERRLKPKHIHPLGFWDIREGSDITEVRVSDYNIGAPRSSLPPLLLLEASKNGAQIWAELRAHVNLTC